MNQAPASSSTTASGLAALRSERKAVERTDGWKRGHVIVVKTDRWGQYYGFIDDGVNQNNYYFHQNGSPGVDFSKSRNKMVDFYPVKQDDGGQKAMSVQFVDK